ncbi:hypothetical protein EDEG_01207 [Edhazardia aedis USNM 41457]|uniref:Uncharacterized protein n=1 Tax=Edhazardia aedis (strain USNM 41457) TaxID=1003232 RepID=J8ZY85_EDHAE|nr:hypothetical protein EDEG_01207 [Edhazardia aedis USNM 41457]|eukprot:EJW04593.1 hypothetical protein EDEG_01207 [Edhazardia aedis USNM 41457]
MSVLQEELYSIDISKNGQLIAFGGKSDTLTLAKFPSLISITSETSFTDSIIYVKFILNDVILCATLDGNLSLHVLENGELVEVDNRDLEEDISFIDVINDLVVVGTNKGSIHIFSQDLQNEILFVGQHSEIRDIKIIFDESFINNNENCDNNILQAENAINEKKIVETDENEYFGSNFKGKLYSLSESHYMIFDLFTQGTLYKRSYKDFRTFNIVNKDLLFIGNEGESLLIKDNVVLQKYLFGSECTALVDDYLVSGGSGFSLTIINIKSPSNCFNLRFLAENVEGISKIVRLSKNIVGIATFCGKIAIGDVRSGETFKFYDCGVGIIYDMKFFRNYVAVCGNAGLRIVML